MGRAGERVLICPIFRGQIEEEDPAVGTGNEMLGKQKENQVKVVSWQKHREGVGEWSCHLC